MSDYNIIDRITAIKLELEYETNNIYYILIAIRNILHQSDGMSYIQIKNILIQYFTIYPNQNVNYNLINLITNPLTAYNNSMLSILLNFHNQNNQNTNFNNVNNLQSNSDDLESLESLDSDDDNFQNNSTNSTFIHNQNYTTYPLSDITNNTFNQNFNNLFYGPENDQLFNLFEPNISNNINSIFSLSNFLGQEINSYNEINNNNILNLFNQIFNVPINQNYQDIPIVITDESFDKLKKCKYVELQDDIKFNNKKCMITLDEFQDNDDILVLPCNHVFKIDEITDWLKHNSYKCPICRNDCGNYYAKMS